MYTNPITRLHPTAFILLIDRSGSMGERIVFGGGEMTKARAVSMVAGSFIDELLFRATREGGVRDYYDIAVLGYSGDGVRSLLSPAGEFTTPSRLAASAVRRQKISRERLLPSGRTTIAVTEHNVWIEPRAEGATPMCGALEEALSLAERWCRAKRNHGSYPPTVINITDGEASDGGADRVGEPAAKIRATGTDDGHTLLVNIHLARRDDPFPPVLFPSSPDQLPDNRYARLLWDISSEMPEGYNDTIAGLKGLAGLNGLNGLAGRNSNPGPFRAMGFGSHASDLAAMMNIGSINSVVL
ncbi:MAG: VWA domain-containing protein [Alistipes sp.]|jgi:hypothetical protein|nr:VWA domain-containing protein [Alistipes sp.]